MAEVRREENHNDLSSSLNPDSEIDRQEENLNYNQQISYEYTVNWALKALIGSGPIPQKAVKWQGKIGED